VKERGGWGRLGGNLEIFGVRGKEEDFKVQLTVFNHSEIYCYIFSNSLSALIIEALQVAGQTIGYGIFTC